MTARTNRFDILAYLIDMFQPLRSMRLVLYHIRRISVLP